MAILGPNSAGTGADDAAVGTVTWSNPSNITTSDDVRATATVTSSLPKDKFVKIVKANGSIGSTDKADTVTVWPAADAYVSYGGSADLWGEAWFPADINNSNFGVVIAAQGAEITHYLKATNFGFSIPMGAIINGILVEIERSRSGTDPFLAKVDNIRITITYSIGGGFVQLLS